MTATLYKQNYGCALYYVIIEKYIAVRNLL